MTTHDKWLKLLKRDKDALTDFYCYLNELRTFNQERLIKAETMDQVRRLQGSIMTLDEFVKFTKLEDEETEIQNQYLGATNNEPLRN